MNGRRRFLVGTVLYIQNSSFTYPACQNCFSRLIHTPGRYECHRCGSSCKDATHRYKLCVKVSEDRKLHVITVFGKCVEKVFGTSADSLERHLQVSARGAGDLESDKAQELLFQAAEYCLIGRIFIFAVKIPGDPSRGDTGSLSYYPRMVACQIILPNDEPIGCTVLSHFNRLLESELSGASINPRPDLSTDTTHRDSRHLGLSDGSQSLHQSGNGCMEYWQQSLGLSPLVNTPAESASCDCRQCQRNRANLAKEQKFQDDEVFVQRKVNPEDIDPSSTTSAITPRINHPSLHTPYTHSTACARSPPQTSSHFHSFCSKSKMAFGQESDLQKDCNSGSCRSQSCLASQNVKAAESHQAEDGTWDEFPFSESLSAFIAGIEDGEGARANKESKLYVNTDAEESNENHCRAFIAAQGALLLRSTEQSQNVTVIRNTAPHSMDESSDSESNTLVLNSEITRSDDTSLPSKQTVAVPVSDHVPEPLGKSGILDSISSDSFASLPANPNPSVTLQSATCSPPNVVSNCAEDNLERCRLSYHCIKAINKCDVSLVKGSFAHQVGVEIGQKSTREEADLRELSNLNSNDRDCTSYNASADLFDTSHNMEGTVAMIPQSIYTLKRRIGEEINRRCLKNPSISDSPRTDVVPYCRRHSHSRADYLQADKVDDFLPYLQSTPVLRRLSATSGFGTDRRLSNNARSSMFSIGRRSSGSITNLLIKKMKQTLSDGKPAMFCAIANHFPLYSPISSSETSGAATVGRRRTMFFCRSVRRMMILENKENSDSQTYDGIRCAVMESDFSNVNRDQMDECDHNTLVDIGNLSPVTCSSQQSEVQVNPTQKPLPSDWSPELFSEKSNICQQSDHLQRRLF